MLATIATRMVGTAAMIENKPTMRTCSRAPARPRRRACTMQADLAADDRDQHDTVSAVEPSKSVTTTLWVGGNRRQAGQHQEGRERRQQRDADRDRSEQPDGMRRPPNGATRIVANWQDWSDGSHASRLLERRESADRSSRRRHATLMYLYNNVAQLRQFRGCETDP